MFLKCILDENDHVEHGVESDILDTESSAINDENDHVEHGVESDILDTESSAINDENDHVGHGVESNTLDTESSAINENSVQYLTIFKDVYIIYFFTSILVVNTTLDLNSEYPTDRGRFPDNLTDSNLKKQIIAYGPCKPINKYLLKNVSLKNCGRYFSIDYYHLTTKTGMKIPRQWLCFSVIMSKVYCETCWLFANRLNANFKYNWIQGICDWQNLSTKIMKHEKFHQHLEAVQIRLLWVKNETIEKNVEKQISIEAQFWKDVLTRLIKIILSLTAGNCALRGNEGKKNTDSEGNFLRTVKLIAEYDPVLNKLLYNEEMKIKYLSWKIQNELIELLALNVKQLICDEIRNAQCFTIIMDSTQDITKVDQVSLIIRYVIVDYEEKSFKIMESFLGFYPLIKHGAEDHVNLIYEILNNCKLDIKRCRGQGYDGASVMSGAYTGVQKRISDVVPSASYIHCTAHSLNLVISDIAKSSQKVALFFDLVQDIFLFFSKSAPRWASLAFGEKTADQIRNKVLKKVLQSPQTNLHKACDLLQGTILSIEKMRDGYDDVVGSASELCHKWGISTTKPTTRKIYSKQYCGEIQGDRRLDVPEEKFCIAIFYPLIDTALFQLRDRFKGLHSVSRNFEFLLPQNIVTMKESDIVKSCYDFISFYNNDVTSDLIRQLISLKEFIKNTKIQTIQELSSFIIEYDLSSLYNQILTACIIYLSLPVTVATAERSFSKLKLLKNYLRNSISQDRLTGISILNIEKSRTKELDIEKLIHDFSNMKARKKNFLK
ncbi:zinc finger MYM-type protein 1-like [Acyrthosiphon pisum]|uniref:Zinc finger MYM-type protein 1-like n=1 Tax=Acyrthosiphon pisum TaxID=7029 RepID=A0A8R2JQD3_ACYPI|nr:zinc finger MYM-type protein 1-like [Acyrthosiphon pisum]